MNTAIEFKRIEAGKYYITFNGEILATITNFGANSWNLDEQTEAFDTFYVNTNKAHRWMLEDNWYSSKGQIAELFKFAANTINS